MTPTKSATQLTSPAVSRLLDDAEELLEHDPRHRLAVLAETVGCGAILALPMLTVCRWLESNHKAQGAKR